MASYFKSQSKIFYENKVDENANLKRKGFHDERYLCHSSVIMNVQNWVSEKAIGLRNQTDSTREKMASD